MVVQWVRMVNAKNCAEHLGAQGKLGYKAHTLRLLSTVFPIEGSIDSGGEEAVLWVSSASLSLPLSLPLSLLLSDSGS